MSRWVWPRQHKSAAFVFETGDFQATASQTLSSAPVLAHYMREVIQEYLNNIKKNGMPNVIGVEMPFSFNIDDKSVVRGYIDRVDRVAPGEYRVVDYKTSKNEKYLSELK